MAFKNDRKRRTPHGPSKNELRAARHQANLARTHAGTLRQPFREGLGFCQMASYADSKAACGTKPCYDFKIEYKGETPT